MAKLVIGLGDESPVVKLPETIISTPGLTLPRYRHPVTNIRDLIIRQNQHNIARVSSVTVTDSTGDTLWIDTRIDPNTGDVTIHADIPITGFILID